MINNAYKIDQIRANKHVITTNHSNAPSPLRNWAMSWKSGCVHSEILRSTPTAAYRTPQKSSEMLRECLINSRPAYGPEV
jgi:hypothetical protein